MTAVPDTTDDIKIANIGAECLANALLLSALIWLVIVWVASWFVS